MGSFDVESIDTIICSFGFHPRTVSSSPPNGARSQCLVAPMPSTCSPVENDFFTPPFQSAMLPKSDNTPHTASGVVGIWRCTAMFRIVCLPRRAVTSTTHTTLTHAPLDHFP